MLDGHGDLAIAQLIFYIPVLPIAIFVGIKHGISRSSGWFFLIFLSLIRIVGAIMTVVVENQSDPDPVLIGVAATLSTLGLSPLTLCTLGILKRLHNEMPRKPVQPRLFFLLGAIPIAGLVLSVVGGVHLSSSPTDPSKVSSAVTYLEVSSILFIVTVALLGVVTFLVGVNINQVILSDRKLYYAVVFSLPFLLVRCIYSILAAYNYTNTTSPFNSRSGSIFVEAFMATFEEFIVVLAYVIAGFVTPKANLAPQAADPAHKLASSDHEQGYAYQQPAYPVQSYPLQQTGRVGV